MLIHLRSILTSGTTAEHISEVWVLCGVWREGLGGEVLTVANDAVRWPAQVGGPPPPLLPAWETFSPSRTVLGAGLGRNWTQHFLS